MVTLFAGSKTKDIEVLWDTIFSEIFKRGIDDNLIFNAVFIAGFLSIKDDLMKIEDEQELMMFVMKSKNFETRERIEKVKEMTYYVLEHFK